MRSGGDHPPKQNLKNKQTQLYVGSKSGTLFSNANVSCTLFKLNIVIQALCEKDGYALHRKFDAVIHWIPEGI